MVKAANHRFWLRCDPWCASLFGVKKNNMEGEKRGVITGGNFPLENNTKLSFQLFQKRAFLKGKPTLSSWLRHEKKYFFLVGRYNRVGCGMSLKIILWTETGKWWGCSNFGGLHGSGLMGGRGVRNMEGQGHQPQPPRTHTLSQPVDSTRESLETPTPKPLPHLSATPWDFRSGAKL